MATGALFVLFIAASSVGMELLLMSAAELPLAHQTSRGLFFFSSASDILKMERATC